MNIEVRRLTPKFVADYVNFFDKTPHADNKEEHKRYCVWYCNDDCVGKRYSSTAEARENCAIQYMLWNKR